MRGVRFLLKMLPTALKPLLQPPPHPTHLHNLVDAVEELGPEVLAHLAGGEKTMSKGGGQMDTGSGTWAGSVLVHLCRFAGLGMCLCGEQEEVGRREWEGAAEA